MKSALNIGLLRWIGLTSLILVTGCTPPKRIDTSPNHIQQAPVAVAPVTLPTPVKAAPTLPPPQLTPRIPTYTVVVNDVPVKDLLF